MRCGNCKSPELRATYVHLSAKNLHIMVFTCLECGVDATPSWKGLEWLLNQLIQGESFQDLEPPY